MKFKLKRNLFDLLINVPDVNQYIFNKFEIDDYVNFNIDTKNIREVQLLINDEIVLNGMDNQENVNGIGLELYKLYDEILYQKDNK